ncbi:MAG: MFS transporter [Candidatus Accumulibacter sp.]|jgi:AAA family ATP:ADP antiporter|nr:MFS transporter [Accumulibacter sp.]
MNDRDGICARAVSRLLNLKTNETPAVLSGLFLFFLLFVSYSMLRPVRETMGIAGGVRNLQWLFTGTFIATLAVLPIFGWVASKVSRRAILTWTYGFFTLNLLVFSTAMLVNPGSIWLGRIFYIWLSVFNLLAISLAWSVLADVFSREQAKRLFAMIAAGASVGGLAGPLLGTRLVSHIGHAGLLFLSALLLAGSMRSATALHRWRDRTPLTGAEDSDENSPEGRQRPIGGNPFSGATAVFSSPYLFGISIFVLLLSSVSTFLYFEQARLVAEIFPDRTQQTEVFGRIDSIVQALAIMTQIFFTGRITKKLGIGVLLIAVPIAMAAGFAWLAIAPVFSVCVIVMVVRRTGEFALVRPGREMLYTVIPPDGKYKAKNFTDTVVYRGGDAISGWVRSGLTRLGDPSLAMLIGSILALVWAAVGFGLARKQTRLENQIASSEKSP